MENLLIQERTSNEQLTARLQVALGELEGNTRRQSQREATKTKEAPLVKAPPNSLSSSLGSGGKRGQASEEERSHTGVIAAALEAPQTLLWARTFIKQASSWNTAQGTLARLLGINNLHVVMNTERLTTLVRTDAHEEDHRQDPKDVLARARSLGVWVPRGTQLARKVIRGYFRCKAQNRMTQTQIMVKLPEERLKAARPFQSTALDLFGPSKVKDVAKGRQRFKCWGLTLSCLATRAAALHACPG